MGFFDKREKLEAGEPGSYLTAAETQDLIADRTALTILGIVRELDSFDKDYEKEGRAQGERYTVTLDVNGVERKKSFGIGARDGSETSRDEQLADAMAYIAEGNVLDEKVVLEQDRASKFISLVTA